MTTTALPTDPTEPNPFEVASVGVAALHLSITENWKSGASHNIHLLENGDIGVILALGQGGRGQIPNENVTGHVVVALSVDDDHDEVHFSGTHGLDDEEILGQAIEALVACRSALMRVRKA